MKYSSLHIVLFLSTLGCDFCIPTTVSVLIAEQSKENGWNCWICVLKKRHYLLKEHCRKWVKLSYPRCFSLIFRSSWIGGGRMQGKGHEVCYHAMQLFSFLHHRCSWITQQCGNRWGWVNAAMSSMLCALLPIFSLQTVHFIYTLYMICFVYCNCMMKLNECISLLNTDSCTSFCVGKIHGVTVIYCRHWLLFEHSI